MFLLRMIKNRVFAAVTWPWTENKPEWTVIFAELQLPNGPVITMQTPIMHLVVDTESICLCPLALDSILWIRILSIFASPKLYIIFSTNLDIYLLATAMTVVYTFVNMAKGRTRTSKCMCCVYVWLNVYKTTSLMPKWSTAILHRSRTQLRQQFFG